MQELRWILLGLGVAFLLGLWIWETRRPRQASPEAEARAGERFEPILANLEGARTTMPVQAPQQENDERIAREPLGAPRVIAADNSTFDVDPVLSAIDEPAADVALAERTASIDAWPKEQKIVTLRVAAPPLERFEGKALVGALQAEGLAHGRYEIFHRDAAGDRTIFSVASLVEPGTFDLGNVAGKKFPGVTIFAVLPGPLAPMATFDAMLVTARNVAERLHGVVQDERGASLSTQRLQSLREGLIDYQHRLDRLSAAGQR